MKLLIVDDHPVVREGLAAMLRQTGPDTDVLQAGSVRKGWKAPQSMAISMQSSSIWQCRAWVN